MIRSYVLSLVLLFACATSLSGMVPRIAGPATLPMTTVWNVIKNDICSGGLIFVPTLQAALPMGAIALLKMLHHGGFTFAELLEGEIFAVLFGSLQFSIMGFCLANIVGKGEGYNENNFVHSKNAFRARNVLRYSLAVLYSVLEFKFLQGITRWPKIPAAFKIFK